MICPDCEGRGFNYSDPDGKILECQTCESTGEVEKEELHAKAKPVRGVPA